MQPPQDMGTGRGFGARFARGWRLATDSLRLVRQQPGMLWVAVVAAVVDLVIAGAAAAICVLLAQGAPRDQTPASVYVVGIVALFLIALVAVLAQAAIVVRVLGLLKGEPVGNSEAWSTALAKSPRLVAFAIANFIVRLVVETLDREGGILGAILGATALVAWRLASFFAIPLMLAEDLSMAKAVKRSVALTRQRWGEEVVGGGVFALLSLVGILVLALVGIVLGMILPALGAVVAGIGFMALLLVLSVAGAAFKAVLYRYATTGSVPEGYDATDLAATFRPRPAAARRSF